MVFGQEVQGLSVFFHDPPPVRADHRAEASGRYKADLTAGQLLDHDLSSFAEAEPLKFAWQRDNAAVPDLAHTVHFHGTSIYAYIRRSLNQVALRGLDLDASRFEVLHAPIELVGFASHLEQNPPLIPRDVRPPDVGHDLELTAELVDHRFFDQGRTEDQLEPPACHRPESKPKLVEGL